MVLIMKDRLSFVVKLIYKKLNKKTYFVYVFLDLISTIASLWSVSILGNIVNETFTYYRIPLVYTITYAVVKVILVAIMAALNRLNNDIDSEAGFVLEKYCLNKMYTTSYLNVIGQNSAEINQKINMDCNNITQLVLFQSIDFVKNIFILIVCEMLIGVISLKCMIFVTSFVITNAIAYLLMKNIICNKERELQNYNIELFSKFHLAISKMKSIRNCSLKNRVFKDIDKQYNTFFDSRRVLVKYENIYSVIKEMLSLSFQIGLLVVGCYCLVDGKMNIAQWIVITTYFSYVSQAAFQLLESGEMYLKLGISIDRIWEYLDEPDIKSGDIDSVSGDLIECNDVKFSYKSESEKKILLNCIFKKNNIYWIRGANGAGKSTMINLITGLYGNDFEGEIYFDGLSTKKLKLESIIDQNVLVVEQFPFIYAKNLYEYVDCNDDKAISAEFEKYNMNKKDIIEKMKNGLIDEELSGGEKQKLEIIRAMLSKKKILIFDEITASIDERSKKIFFDELAHKKKEHIIMMISHDHPVIYDAVVEM